MEGSIVKIHVLPKRYISALYIGSDSLVPAIPPKYFVSLQTGTFSSSSAIPMTALYAFVLAQDSGSTRHVLSKK